MAKNHVPAHLNRLRALIIEHGWAVQGVFATDPGDTSHAYTIGLTDAGLPELMITGLSDQKLATVLLNAAARQHVKEPIKPGDVLSDLANVDLRAIECDERQAQIQQAHNYFNDPEKRHGRVKLIQLIWPDKSGAYPDTIFWSLDPRLQPLYPRKS